MASRPRARCRSGWTVRVAGREVPGASQGCDRGKLGPAPARPGRTPPCPRSRLTRAREVPVEASHSPKALGDHGSAERRRRARCPPAWAWERRGAGQPRGGLAEEAAAAAEAVAAEAVAAAADPAGTLPRAAAPSWRPLQPRPAPRPACQHRPGGGSGETQQLPAKHAAGGLRGGGGLGAGEVWATAGSAALGSRRQP